MHIDKYFFLWCVMFLFNIKQRVLAFSIVNNQLSEEKGSTGLSEQTIENDTSRFTDGRKYVGSWVNGKWNGQGVLTWSQGDRFEGNFKDNNRNGKGIYYSFDGTKYVGSWTNDKLNGPGVLILSTGDRYEGPFKDDNMNGNGTYYFANGIRYVGEFIDGQMTGQGVYTLPNGNRLDETLANQNGTSHFFE